MRSVRDASVAMLVAKGRRMTIHSGKPLFAWECVEDSRTIKTVRTAMIVSATRRRVIGWPTSAASRCAKRWDIATRLTVFRDVDEGKLATSRRFFAHVKGSR